MGLQTPFMSTSSSQLLSFSQWSCALGCEHSYSCDGSGTIYRTAFVRLRASTLSDPVPKSSRRTLWHVKGQTTGCKFRHNDAEFQTQHRSDPVVRCLNMEACSLTYLVR